jgi:hypothetical protein
VPFRSGAGQEQPIQLENRIIDGACDTGIIALENVQLLFRANTELPARSAGI